MDSKRKVVYYTSQQALDGFYPDKTNQKNLAEGIFLGLGYRIVFEDNRPFQITEAIIEDANSQDIKCIDYRLLVSTKH